MTRPDVARFQETAVLALSRGDFEAALRACAALEKLDPTNPDWPKRTAKVLRRMHRTPEEVQALLRAAELEVRAGGELRAAAILKQILDLIPNHAEARARLARLGARGGPSRPPAPAVTPARPAARPAAWQAVQSGGLQQLALREVLGGARPAGRGQGVYHIPLESGADPELSLELDALDLGLEADAPLHGQRPPPPPRAAPQVSDDDAILAVEAEFRAAERTNKALSATPLFKELSEAQFSQVLMHARFEAHEAGAVIFRQGTPGTALYVVASGRVQVVDEAKGARRVLSELGEGDVFGEMALITDQPRSATVVAASDVELIALDRAVVAKLSEEDPPFLAALLRFFRHRSVSRLLTTNPVFSGLSTRDHAALEGRFRFLEVDAGAEFLTTGQVPEGLIGLLSGQAEVVVGQVAVARLGPGDLMGEMSLMSGAPAMGTVRALTRCYAVQMSAADFARILGARPQARAYLEEVAARRRSATEAVLARTERDGSARKVVF